MRVPQRISELSQWEKAMSKSFFPSLTCLAYQGLGSSGFRRDGEGLGSQQQVLEGKIVWQCLPPCSVLVQDQLRRLQPSPRPLHPPISKINEEILTNSKRLEHCLLLDLLVQRMTILPEWISFSSPRCHCQMASHAGRAARMWLEGRRMRGTQAPMCANQTGAMGQVLMPEFGEGV